MAEDPKRLWGVGEVLRLSWPASLGMLNSTVMRFVDGLMVSWLGTVALSAQFVGGLSSFVPESFATGVLMIVNTYVAQNMGAGRLDKCGQYAWAGLAIALVVCVLVMPLVPLAPDIFGAINSRQVTTLQGAIAATADPGELVRLQTQLDEVRQLVDLEVMYFRYMVVAIFVTLTARPLEQFFYGVHRPRIVLAASIAANLVNIVLVYLLMFGHSGLEVLDRKLGLDLAHSWLGRLNIPKFGLEGGAWANIVSWGLYMLVLLGVFLSRRINRLYATRRPLSVRFHECRDLLRVGWPAGVQFVSDVFPWAIMTWLIGRFFGPTELAATTAAMRWMPISFMPAVGIGVAATALVGRYLGERRADIARRRAHAALAVSLVYMAACGALFFVLREPMIRLFVTVLPSGEPQALAAEQARQIISIGGWVMICAATFQLFDAMGIVFTGSLRGAGDTLWPMVFTIVFSWGLVAGGGWAMAAYLPQLGSVGPWITGSLYVAVLGVALAWRFERGAWQRIDLLGRREPPPGPVAQLPQA